jgi:hypothetical protein
VTGRSDAVTEETLRQLVEDVAAMLKNPVAWDAASGDRDAYATERARNVVAMLAGNYRIEERP